MRRPTIAWHEQDGDVGMGVCDRQLDAASP
jgi:hypothetical protein